MRISCQREENFHPSESGVELSHSGILMDCRSPVGTCESTQALISFSPRSAISRTTRGEKIREKKVRDVEAKTAKGRGRNRSIHQSLLSLVFACFIDKCMGGYRVPVKGMEWKGGREIISINQPGWSIHSVRILPFFSFFLPSFAAR